MGNTDSLPVLSQVKSGVQYVAGDSDGALKTQQNFIRGCPVVSQVTSAVQLIGGDTQGAKETQMYCVNNLSNLANGIPVLGHAKGIIHCFCGDTSGGYDAFWAASRSAGVIAGGIGGGLLGGPAGAVVGGIAGGATMDGIITGADTACTGEFSPHGHVALGYMATKGKLDVGTAFDWAMIPVFDGLTGRAYSKDYQLMLRKKETRTNLRHVVEQKVKAGEITLLEGETASSLVKQLESAAFKLKETMKNAEPGALGESSVAAVVIDVEGNEYAGYSFKLRKAVNMDAFQGEVPSAAQIMENRLPGRAPRIRGVKAGQAQCAEIHALHKFHQSKGLGANPVKTIVVLHDGTGVKAYARCGNCIRVGNYVSMGDVLTDALAPAAAGVPGYTITREGDGGPIDLSRDLSAAMYLLRQLKCRCDDEDHELDAAELSQSKSGSRDHQD